MLLALRNQLLKELAKLVHGGQVALPGPLNVVHGLENWSCPLYLLFPSGL